MCIKTLQGYTLIACGFMQNSQIVYNIQNETTKTFPEMSWNIEIKYNGPVLH